MPTPILSIRINKNYIKIPTIFKEGHIIKNSSPRRAMTVHTNTIGYFAFTSKQPCMGYITNAIARRAIASRKWRNIIKES